ncbi:MAG TPA: 7-cyano-7-deazaguanine synthase QueC [Candidatus Thermoplasmatota archaeon]|nr:7-cyano-7-deazaguanine synthase QueC [Candidatus Thermoplasmatota archaeon]
MLLLSGGLDSCTAGAIAREQGYVLHAVSFDYGQRHRKELAAAKRVGKALGVASHRVLKVPLGDLGGSALTDRKVAVPDAPQPGKIGQSIPSTYVPARNTVFLSLALAVAEVEGASALVIGANALDYSGYPDCRPEFLDAFERMAALATKAGVEERTVKVLAPLVHLSKRDIVTTAHRLKAPIALTWSCYRGGASPCGTCESCVLRVKGFAEAGIADPALAAGPSGPRRATGPKAARRSGGA